MLGSFYLAEVSFSALLGEGLDVARGRAHAEGKNAEVAALPDLDGGQGIDDLVGGGLGQ